MSGQDPKPVILASEGLDGGSFAHVPDANGLVLGVGDDELVLGVEEGTGDVVEVAAAGVDLPSFGVAHAPELDLAVVAGGDDERECGVEGGPVDAAVVALENVLDDGVGVAEEVGLGVGSLDLVLWKRAPSSVHLLYHWDFSSDKAPRKS